MIFLCLILVNGEAVAALSDEDRARADRENLAYYDWLVANGHNVMSSALHPPETATVMRMREGSVSMTDGPYVETKEHIAGLMLIRAGNREEAMEVAALAPVLRYGGAVEVREAHYREPE